MPMKYPEEFIIRTVKQHEAGTPIKELSQSLNVASSTIYHWAKIYKTIPRKKGEYTPAGYQRLIDHEKKLERQLETFPFRIRLSQDKFCLPNLRSDADR